MSTSYAEKKTVLVHFFEYFLQKKGSEHFNDNTKEEILIKLLNQTEAAHSQMAFGVYTAASVTRHFLPNYYYNPSKTALKASAWYAQPAYGHR